MNDRPIDQNTVRVTKTRGECPYCSREVTWRDGKPDQHYITIGATLVLCPRGGQ